MNAKVLAVGVFMLICAGCAGEPPDPNSDMATISKACDRELYGIYDFGAVGNAAVTAMYTVFTLGTNIGEYEFCKYIDTLHPAPVSSISNGLYRSYGQSFEVEIPERLKQSPQNPSGIWQSEGNVPEVAMFPSDETAGRVFFAEASSKLQDKNVSLSPREFEQHFFTQNGVQYLDARGVRLRRLYEEDLTLRGDPAVFVIYEEDSQANTASMPGGPATPDAPVFLLYWVIKTPAHAARLIVVWPENCPKCGSGPEAEIRNMSPGIATFIDSFKFIGDK